MKYGGYGLSILSQTISKVAWRRLQTSSSGKQRYSAQEELLKLDIDHLLRHLKGFVRKDFSMSATELLDIAQTFRVTSRDVASYCALLGAALSETSADDGDIWRIRVRKNSGGHVNNPA